MGHGLSTERPQITSFLESEMIALEGADSVKVYVHKGLLKAHSKVSGECWWSCFHSDTIKRFVEYLYQGDYTGLLPGSAPTAAPGSLATPKSLNYQGVFVSHAELFMLAKSRGIDPLGEICMAKLQEDMGKAHEELPDSMFSENVVELLRYSYSHCYMSDNPAWGELQKITSKVCVEKIGLILEMPGASLLSGEGKLMKDLMIGAVERLKEAESRLADMEKGKKPAATHRQGYSEQKERSGSSSATPWWKFST
ncbi:unnamed protein product [Tuber aestivum]|uniref:BTB domain-containing protein n=1 Tax=Tuber aestivum TaxID=59557 RepID=A0A292PRQ8_9PEZI|nr:unnamed protein product [Tuber aestivum]